MYNNNMYQKCTAQARAIYTFSFAHIYSRAERERPVLLLPGAAGEPPPSRRKYDGRAIEQDAKSADRYTSQNSDEIILYHTPDNTQDEMCRCQAEGCCVTTGTAVT